MYNACCLFKHVSTWKERKPNEQWTQCTLFTVTWYLTWWHTPHTIILINPLFQQKKKNIYVQICHHFSPYVCPGICTRSSTYLSNAVEWIEVELLARVEEQILTHSLFVLARHGRDLNWGQLLPKQRLTARSRVLRGFHVLVRAFFGRELGPQLWLGTFRGSHLASGHSMIRINFRFRSWRKSTRGTQLAGRPDARRDELE